MKKIRKLLIPVIALTSIFSFSLFLSSCQSDEIVEEEPSEATVTSIAVRTQPTKTVYSEGETFDTTGLTITVTYSDGSTSTVAGSQCEISPSGALTVEDEVITITYGGQSTTVNITVGELSSIVLAVNENALENRYATLNTYDFSSALSLSATYSKDGEVISTQNVTDYTLVFSYQGEDQTIEDLVCDVDNVSGFERVSGTYLVSAQFGGLTAEETFTIDVFNGYRVEAENIYDNTTDYDNGVPYGMTLDTYVSRELPEGEQYYTMMESLEGQSWSAVDPSDGAANCVRPTSGSLDTASGGQYLGEFTRIQTISIHFFSEVEQNVDIVMTAASGMRVTSSTTGETILSNSMTLDAPIEKIFDIYAGEDSLDKSSFTFDDTKKIDVSDVVLPGVNLGYSTNSDTITTQWQEVNLGETTLSPGDNVYYIDKVYNASDSYWTELRQSYNFNAWLINIDCFDVIFTD